MIDRTLASLALLGPLLFAPSCGDNMANNQPDGGTDASGDAMSDAPGDAMGDAGNPDMPMLLRDTGLYSDFDKEVFAAGVRLFRPTVELWSDGASKRRFVLLPAGSQIDTTDMDFWKYPVGTKLWKEFIRDGVRVETRLLSKISATQWFMMAYAWNQAQTEAVAAPMGAMNVLGTEHDIPAQSGCRKCHLRMADIAIGFTALSLDHPGTPPMADEPPEATLEVLVNEGLLASPPAGTGTPYFTVPGDAVSRPALEYIHVNCGNCHNPTSDLIRDQVVKVEMRLLVDQLGTVEETAVYRTAVGQPQELSGLGPQVTAIIEPGSVDASAVHVRMNLRDGDKQMPETGTEIVDSAGLGLVDAWIQSLPPTP